MACRLTAPSHYWNNVDLSSLRSSEIHLRAISKEVPIHQSLNHTYMTDINGGRDNANCDAIRVKKTAWWRHQKEAFSALLAICAGNSPVPGEFPTQRPVTRSFDVYYDLCPNKRWVNKREAGDLRHNRAHYDVIVMCMPISWNCMVISCKYTAGDGWGIFGDLDVNWNVLQSPYSLIYSMECQTLFHVGRKWLSNVICMYELSWFY